MTNHAAEPAVRHHANDAPPPLQQGPDASQPVRKASLIAGVALLLMAALAGFGYNFAIHGLITAGNAARTAQDIMAHQGLFRSGIACLFLVIGLDVVAALGLYGVFSPVGKGISAVAVGLRLVYAGIFAVAVVQLIGAARLLGSGTSLPASGADRVHAQALSDINRFTDIWHAGLIVFGLYLLMIAWLACRSCRTFGAAPGGHLLTGSPAHATGRGRRDSGEGGKGDLVADRPPGRLPAVRGAPRRHLAARPGRGSTGRKISGYG